MKDAALQQTLGVETKGSQVSILQPGPNRPGTCDLKSLGEGAMHVNAPTRVFLGFRGSFF